MIAGRYDNKSTELSPFAIPELESRVSSLARMAHRLEKSH
jgi:hypothetical protein